jgi:fructoselysine 6-kinase
MAAIGDNCLDVYVEQDLLTVGGNALNVAANWRRMDLDSRYFGAVGNDDAGVSVRSGVRRIGLDDTDIVTLEGATGVTLIRLVDSNREFLFEEFGVGVEWHPSDAIIDTVACFDWVHAAGIAEGANIRERLSDRNVRFSVDLSTFHDFDSLAGVEIAFASWNGPLDGGAHDLAARMSDAGALFAVVMCGEYGSLMRSGTETTAMKANMIKPVDTCGAGDSFIASYIKSHVAGESAQTSLVKATANATRTCLHVGGFEQAPCTVPEGLKRSYYRFASPQA